MTKEKRSGFRWMRAGCGFAAVVVLGTLALILFLAWAFTSLLSPIGDRANAFMMALKARDYDAAYALLSDEAQSDMTAGEFAARMSDYATPPTDWRFTNFSIRGAVGYVKGRVNIDGQEYNSTIDFVYDEAGWAISGFDLDRYGDTEVLPQATREPQ